MLINHQFLSHNLEVLLDDLPECLNFLTQMLINNNL